MVAGTGLRSLGGYGLAFTVWLLLLLAHRAVLTEPLLLRHRPDDHRRMARGVSADVLLGLVGAATLAVCGLALIGAGSDTFGSPLVVLAVCVPVLLVQDFWRAMAFKQQRPYVALVNDAIFAVVQLGVLAAIAWRSTVTVDRAIGAWGTGAAVAVAIGFVQLNVRPSLRGGTRLLRAEWPTGRWLLADATTQFVADQTYPLLAGAVLARVDFGGPKPHCGSWGRSSWCCWLLATLACPRPLVVTRIPVARGCTNLSFVCDGLWSGASLCTAW